MMSLGRQHNYVNVDIFPSKLYLFHVSTNILFICDAMHVVLFIG